MATSPAHPHRPALLPGLAIVCAILLTGCLDNIYPTANYHPICVGGGPGGTFCLQDGTSVTYFISSSVPRAERPRISGVLTAEFHKKTILNVARHAHPQLRKGDNRETDIIFEKGTVRSGDDGMAWCEDTDPPGGQVLCDQHYIRFRRTSITRGLICHEVGHAVGLTHGNNAAPRVNNQSRFLGCMTKSVSANATLGRHNQGQINGAYKRSLAE